MTDSFYAPILNTIAYKIAISKIKEIKRNDVTTLLLYDV